MAKSLTGQPHQKSTDYTKEGNTETLRWLIDVYRSDARSPYKKVKFATRSNYDGFIRRLDKISKTKLVDLKSEAIQNLYDEVATVAASKGKGDGASMAHGIITVLRTVVSFGATVLENRECIRLSVLLRHMHFAGPKRRNVVPLSAEQVKAIIAKAHEMGWPSIALAQAIQFQCEMSQRDVIGEWVPLSEGTPSEFFNRKRKWIRGLRWSDLDEHLVLTRPQGTMSLEIAPLVMAELRRLPSPLPRSGPMIANEKNQRPWDSADFRLCWRKIARAAGIPDSVRNTDSDFRRSNNDDESRLHHSATATS